MIVYTGKEKIIIIETYFFITILKFCLNKRLKKNKNPSTKITKLIAEGYKAAPKDI